MNKIEQQEVSCPPENFSPYETFAGSLNRLMYYAEGNVGMWNAHLLEAALHQITDVEGLGLALGMQPRVLYPILRYGTSKIVEFAGEDSDGGQRRILKKRLARFENFLNVFPPEKVVPPLS